jgi:CDP-glucose 4,6-dehydratase
MEKTALITGSSGLIGSNLTELLLYRGFNVIGVSKKYTQSNFKAFQFFNPSYNALEGDICDFDFLSEVINKFNPQYIIHLAAKTIVQEAFLDSKSTFEVNIGGTWNVLEAARQCKSLKRIIIASSDMAYGENKNLPYNEDYLLNAIHPYDLSKKITEELSISYFKNFSLPVSITRCGNVFGPYDMNFSRIVPYVIKCCINGEKIYLRSDGHFERCYVYSKDVSRAYLKIMEADDPSIVNGEVFNIGNDVPVTVIDIVKLICNKFECDFENSVIIQDIISNEIKSQYLDCNKIRKSLDWIPEYALDNALDETINWYIKYFKNQLSKKSV